MLTDIRLSRAFFSSAGLRGEAAEPCPTHGDGRESVSWSLAGMFWQQPGVHRAFIP